MEKPIIEFQNVSKNFSLNHQSPNSSVLESFISVFKKQPQLLPKPQSLWAVKDISFHVMPGESFGIIGRNGSGKSTILKLITRILRPTSGRVVVRGRVSALLELGAGFHSDLTGRENIFLNSAVLGLSQKEVEQNFADIVAFSELEKFIDVPIKHYSSGMYMRLGFSVAIHVKPAILIVDEILAVGDQEFQDKCLNRIYEMKRQGVTVIMVSHNLQMMQSFCSHLLWIEGGHLKMIGETDKVTEQYTRVIHETAILPDHSSHEVAS